MSEYSSKKPKLIDDDNTANIANNIQNYTDTNMYVEYFGNSDKLKASDERIMYGDAGDNVENDDKNNELDDDLNKYRKVSHTIPQNIFAQKDHAQSNDNAQEKYHKSEHHTENKKHESYNTESTSGDGSKEYDPEDESTWTKDELLLRKLDMLRKLGELVQHGGVKKLSQNYSLNSDYKTMKFEYDLHSGIRSKKNAVEWMSGMMIGIVKGMELLNDNLNPFDIKFENTWSNKVTADVSDYYDVLGEIYEKYTTPGKKMAPELKLFLMLTGSAVSIQMHKGISSLTSGASKELDGDPNIVQQLRQKAEQDQKNKSKIEEHLDKEHKIATDRANDLHMINKAQTEYTELQRMANMRNLEKFNNTLVLSESAKSAKSAKSSHTSKDDNNSFMAQQMEQNKQREILLQNQRLMEMQKKLHDMRQEEKLLESFNKSKKSEAKPKQLKGTESDKPVKRQLAPKSAEKPKVVSKIVDSDSESESSESSDVSSVSTMSVNPNLENILGKKPQPKSKLSERSVSTVSSPSKKSSKSSEKKQIMLNLDDKLKQIKQSSNTSALKMMGKGGDTERNITLESISFGKKSNKSDGSGSSGKRGRPKKTLKIGLGEK